MKFIFARHGQTEANLATIFQGRLDTPLTKQGIKQAENLGNYIRDMNITECILSPLPRVKQTYDNAIKDKSIPYRIEERLIEICYGDWEGKTRAEIEQKVLKNRNDHRFTYVYPGTYNGISGESYEIQYNERVKSFLEELVSETSDKTFLVISHQGPLLGVKKFFENLSDEETGVVKTPNNMIYVIDMNGQEPYRLEAISL